MSLRLSHLPFSPVTQAESSRAKGLVPGASARPFQRLFSRGASLTVAFVAAALLAACGGGSSDSVGSTGGDLSPRMAQIVGTVEVAKSVEMKVLVISAVGSAPSYLATTSILDQIGVPYDRMVLKGANATALQMVAGTLSDGAGNGKYQGIILETGDLPYEETTKCAALGFSSPCYPSALTAAQWAMLRQYQLDFGVRSATMYTSPTPWRPDANGVQLDLTYGLTTVSERSTDDFTSPPKIPVTATLTVSGAGVFGYLNAINPVIVKNAYTYLATPAVGAITEPLLNATEGTGNYAIVSTFTAPAGATGVGVAPGGWENLAITADSNPELTHTLLLGYGVVNWVTKGVFLGERKIYMTAQPDDLLIPDDLWDPVTKTTPNDGAAVSNPAFRYRNTGADYTSLVDWQTALHNKHPRLAAFRLEMPFNGVGYNTVDPEYLNRGEAPVALPSTDSLSTAVRANPNAFRWINHTWDHTSLDPEGGFTPTVASIVSQLTWNHEVATGQRSGNPNVPAAPKVAFANYVRSAFIQPDISGLTNPVFWEAAQNFGLQYILMDTSKAYANFIPARPVVGPIAPNTGYYSSLDTFVPSNPRIFIIPRYPTSLYYNVSTPAEWESEFNHFYGVNGIVPPPPGQTSWFGGDSSYVQLLDRESDTLVRYMLKYHANSWMFHAANLRAYPGGNGKSTLGDLLNAVATKYSALYNLPVLSPSQAEIGEIMKKRMAYNAAIASGVKGRIVFGPSVTIQVTNPTGAAVTVPLTGAVSGGVSYGGQQIAPLAVVAGGTTTVAAPASWIPAQADMAVTIVPSTSTPLQGGTLTYSVAIRNLGPNSVTGASFSNTLQAGLGTITNVVTQVSAGARTPTFATTPTSLSGLVSMPAGGRITVTYQASVSATATGTLTSTASVTEPADRNDPNSVNNSVTSTVSVGLADVSTLVTLPTTAIAGSVVKGTVTFSNASVVTGGTAVAATAVTGTVTLSNGDVKPFTVGTLTPGQSSVQNFTTTMPSVFGTPLTATSTVVTATPESNKANNVFGGATTTALFADPGVSVNSIPAGTPGSSVQATVVLSNTAGQTAVTFTPQIVVNNGTPYTLTPVTLAAGQTVTSAAINVPITASGGTVTANVTLASVPDLNLGNNSDTKVSGVVYADVSSAVVLPASAVAGTVVTGTATFTNEATAGTSALAVTGTVTLSNGDVKPFTVGTLTVGQSSVHTFTTTMPSTVGTTALSATSTVATTTPESNTANNLFTGATSTALFADPGVLVNSIPVGTPGSTVQTTVILSNTAGQTAVTFTPQIVVNNGTPFNLTPVTLAAGASVTSVPINVPITASGGTVKASVTASSVPDSNLGNNTDTKVSGVVYADVSSTVVLPASAVAGSVVTGTVTFTNEATAGTAALAVTGEVTLSNGDVKPFTVGTLTPGQSSVQTFTTTMGTTTLSATSTAATTTPESNTANNSSSVAVAVLPDAPAPVADVGGGGGGGCTTSPDARFDPLLWMMLLAGGVATGLRRRRTADLVNDRH